MAADTVFAISASIRTRPNPVAGSAIPQYAQAVIEALRVEDPSTERLSSLSREEWGRALAFCDRAQLTLMLGGLRGYALPAWVRERIEGNARDYCPRFRRLKRELFEIVSVLESRGISLVLLKGLAHSPEFTPDPLWRVPGDIDIWCEPGRVYDARDALLELGYRVAGPSSGRHLPPMVRESGWRWTGNYFASDLPIAVELHYALWDEALDLIPARVESDFWVHRLVTRVDGRGLQVLSLPDALGFASLHLLMHILHGDVRLQRAWEIANFLHARASDEEFWARWKNSCAPDLRRLEAIVFELCAAWFGAAMAPLVFEETRVVPSDVRLWLDRYALSPVEGLFRTRKDEIWLHLALLESSRQKRAVFLRRVFPVRASATAIQNVPGCFLRSRFLHHALAVVPTLLDAVRWHWRRAGFDRSFVRFQVVSALYGFGVVIFVVLQNLYLLAAGFREDFLGKVAGITTLGTLTGSIPAGMLVRRIGLRRSLMAAAGGVALISLARAWNQHAVWQLAAGFAAGSLFSVWAICYSPAIAGLSREKDRSLAFSLSGAIGMGVCAVGGLTAGALPRVVRLILRVPEGAPAYRGALLVAAGLIALALPVAAGVQLPTAFGEAESARSTSRILLPLLLVLTLWSADVGVFNPLFNSFFAVRIGLSAGQIGGVYACSQVLQAAALLAAPLLFRRFGNGAGVALLQVATGTSLLALSGARSGAPAAAGYIAYMCFQYMMEPAVLSTLMSRVASDQRTGASALYFFTTSGAAALAAWAGGLATSHVGYPAVLAISGLGAIVCAAFSLRLFR